MKVGFTFDGLHTERDFGLLFVEERRGRILTGEKEVNAYRIAGLSGTLRFPGETYKPYRRGGTLYSLRPIRTEQEGQALMRRVSRWLRHGRKQLIFDHEPGVYLMAEVLRASTLEFSSWPEGGLSVEFEVQPYAYARRETRAVLSLTGAAETDFFVNTGEPAPLCAEIESTGTAPVTGMTLRCGEKFWQFTGLDLAPGQVLKISLERPIGAQLGDGTNALPCCKRLDEITMDGSARHIRAEITGAEGAAAALTLRARGRWV